MTPVLPLLALLGAPAAAAGSATPWNSHVRLVSGNGHGVVVFKGDGAAGGGDGPVLADFRDHLYQQYAADREPGRDLLYDAYFGLGDGGTGAWLKASDAYSYLPATGILQVDRSQGDLAITEWIFAPMGLSHPGWVHLLHVRNDGSAVRTVRLFSLHNHHVGDERHGVFHGDERIWVEGDWLLEQGVGTGLGVAVRAIEAPSSWSCDQVWARMPTDGALDGRCGSAASPWDNDDQVGGLQWDPGSLAPGEEAWVGVVSAFFDEGDPDRAVAPVEAWLAGRDPQTLLADEQAAWAAWVGGATAPADASTDELEVYRQALVFLKMAQVREDNDAFGQIPASLPVAASGGTGDESFSHLWNITWVRDGAYAIQALVAAGYPEEARDALAFLLQGKAGDYAHLVGRDYALSVCRLYGDGSEWSDDDGTGPNVELDNFGLLLWALQGYVAATGDVDFVRDHAAVVFDGIADVLVDVIEDDGLVMADSSIWERHWNGHQQHFAYTQVWAVRGLQDAALLAEAAGEEGRAASYRAAAAGVREGVCATMVDGDGVLAASEEQLRAGSGYLDLAGVDAFNNGTLDAAGPQGRASLAAWTEGLAVASGGGFARNDDGDLYDRQEWVWADLRLAQARRRACDEDGARALEDWVTAQAQENHWTIPELMNPDTAAYAGPAPMMGFGSGLYVLNLLGRAEATADCADGVGWTCEGGGDTGDGGAGDGGAGDGGAGDGGDGDGGAGDGGAGDGGAGDGGKAGGCACAGAPAAPARGAPLLLLPLLGLVRRRSAP
ncbi:glycoside hydrolase family 15 protein [Myxococcota bacterium]|nr:glycoside hydrolase family 15 protein [Myxococcota bacterium]